MNTKYDTLKLHEGSELTWGMLQHDVEQYGDGTFALIFDSRVLKIYTRDPTHNQIRKQIEHYIEKVIGK